ncbi:hypothetical protein V2J52_13955 [Georgenia sp. MJ173]|uniref:hypothetical protein n=1 Tax=Georgenia sunbinii TaxID=3117728 RepID=UPI002F26518B
MNMKLWKIPTVSLAAAALVVVAAPGASAAETECDSDLGSATITGDLVVPAGGTCTLGGASVEGDIFVDEDGWLDATSVTVGGDVIGIDSYGILLDGAAVAGDVVSFTEGLRGGFLYILDSAIDGSVEAGGLDLEISDSTIGGILNSLESNYVDLLRLTVDGDVSIVGSQWGVSAAGVITSGNLAVTGSARDVLIGATPDGGADQWGNTVGGDLILSGNTANLQVAGTTALGSFVLADNDPAANLGAGNQAGAVEGDHTGDAPAAGGNDGDQNVVVVVPERDQGEFIWTIDSTSNLVNLGVAVESGDHFLATGELNPVRVTDTRIDAPAWSVSGQVGDFTAGDNSASGADLGWTPEVVEAGGGAVAGAHVDSGFDGGDGLSVSRVLGSADAEHELGSAVLGADVELKLPVDVETGTYNATLTLTALS